MNREKPADQLRKEKDQRKIEAQHTENVFEDKSRIPNEQNAFKETEYKYGE